VIFSLMIFISNSPMTNFFSSRENGRTLLTLTTKMGTLTALSTLVVYVVEYLFESFQAIEYKHNFMRPIVARFWWFS